MTILQFVHHVLKVLDNFTQMSTDLKNLKNSKCLLLKRIPFKLTVFITDTFRCLHINFLSNWISLRLLKIFLNGLDKGMALFYGCIGTQCIWSFFRNMGFKWSNE